MNAQPEAAALAALRFDNRFTRALPADPLSHNQCRQVTGACFSRVQPTPVAAPRLVAFAPEVAALLDLPPEAAASDEFAQVFAGNRLLPGMDPHATRYGGHQFGNWAGQLGDGRAINLGEVRNARGEHWTLQLKGAGPTPYSRGADGLTVLRSSLREFVCSEAMHHLGVPTTRALSLVLTGEQVVRDMFYDGHPAPEPGAVVCRVARSFTRFGHFQILAARGETALLRQFLDHTLASDFAHLGAPSAATYAAWFDEVCRRTLEMVLHWMRVGFVHGVMNTDNMSILGDTIDYGPYGWLEGYDPDWTPNTTDAAGRRYRFGHQPQIALWNLVQLANAVVALCDDPAPLQAAIGRFADDWQPAWQGMMAAKLGLRAFDPRAGDDTLLSELLELLAAVETDMTLFFRGLAQVDGEAGDDDETLLAPLACAWYDERAREPEQRARMLAWLRRYLARARSDGDDAAERRARMNRVNPLYVPRNYLAQVAIDAVEAGNCDELHAWMETLRRPYDEQPGRERFAARRPAWARHRAGCSMLSCSS